MKKINTIRVILFFCLVVLGIFIYNKITSPVVLSYNFNKDGVGECTLYFPPLTNFNNSASGIFRKDYIVKTDFDGDKVIDANFIFKKGLKYNNGKFTDGEMELWYEDGAKPFKIYIKNGKVFKLLNDFNLDLEYENNIEVKDDLMISGIGDNNNDGIPDQWSYYENGVLKLIEKDRNFDKKADVWIYYKPIKNQKDISFFGCRFYLTEISKIECDNNFDGVIDYKKDFK